MTTNMRTDVNTTWLRCDYTWGASMLLDFVAARISKSLTVILFCTCVVVNVDGIAAHVRSDRVHHRRSGDDLVPVLRCPVVIEVSLKHHTRHENNSTATDRGATFPQHITSTSFASRCTCNRLLEIHCTGGLTSLPQPLSMVIPDVSDDEDDDGDNGYRHHYHQQRHWRPAFHAAKAWSLFHASGQLIAALPVAAFYDMPVRRIVLNFNPIGDQLDSGAFRGIGLILQELHLGACRIRSLRVEMLHGLVQLRRLQLWANAIDTIPLGFFRRSRNLHELVMWGNRIEEIEERTFQGLGRLQRLDLDRNRIARIDIRAFNAMTELELLRLSGNNIHVVTTESFSRLSNLKVLGLDRNGLGFVYPDAFVKTGGLLSLSLSGNTISFLPDDVFAAVRHLRVLRLADNHLNHAWSRTFSGLQSLTVLDLSGNRLVQLPVGTFRHVPRLTHLMLDRNLLNTLERCAVLAADVVDDADESFVLSPSSLSPTSDFYSLDGTADDADDNHSFSRHRPTSSCFPSTQSPSFRRRRNRLRTLSFVGNPIPCDCRIAWLIDDEGDVNGTSTSGAGSCPEGWVAVRPSERPVDVFWGLCSETPESLASIVANDTGACAGTETSCGE